MIEHFITTAVISNYNIANGRFDLSGAKTTSLQGEFVIFGRAVATMRGSFLYLFDMDSIPLFMSISENWPLSVTPAGITGSKVP